MEAESYWVGRSIPRIGAYEKVGGETLFSADISMDGALVLKVLRSTRPNARLVYIKTQRATSIPAVEGVFASEDIPGRNSTGIITKDQPLLAHDKVRFLGAPIALIAARDEEAALMGLRAIESRL